MNAFHVVHLFVIGCICAVLAVVTRSHGIVTGAFVAILGFIVFWVFKRIASLVLPESYDVPICEKCSARTYEFDSERNATIVRCSCHRQGLIRDSRLYEQSPDGCEILIATRNWLGHWRRLDDRSETMLL